MNNKITLVTSIAPKNIENQQKAMSSWIENGFHIVSCNRKDEIELVEDKFPDVEFIEMKRDSQEVTGKPCPYIYDMLQILKEKADQICGVVNSDIHLRNFSEEIGIYIREITKDTVLFMRRQEVKQLRDTETLNSDLFFGGIDVVLFRKSVIDVVEDDGLILGQAMWDYWLPILLEQKGVVLKELKNPLIFHVTHPIQWNDTITEKISWDICKKRFAGVEKKDAVKYLKDKFFSIISAKDIGLCYVTPSMQKKSVLVLGTKEESEQIQSQLETQSHHNVHFMYREEFAEDVMGYDYVLVLPYAAQMSSIFLSEVIWTSETYKIDAMQVLVYLCGNKSNVARIENCNVAMLKKFNDDIEPFAFFKSNIFYEKGSEDVKLHPCQLAVCSVLIEEDEATIWQRQKIEGNVFIFPAGYAARTWVKRFQNIAKEMEILGFLDNNPKLKNELVDDTMIYSPEITCHTEMYDKIIVITNLYTEEIYRQLVKLVPKNKVVIWKDEFDGQLWKRTRNQINGNGTVNTRNDC